MIDISDGLSTDLTHLCQESRVSALLDQVALPLHPLAAKSADSLNFALHGGEDYELLFTAPPATRIPRALGGVPVHRIGTIRRCIRGEAAILLKTWDGRRVPIAPEGWEHFR
jgi:thiamine-monophosphate kinase